MTRGPVHPPVRRMVGIVVAAVVGVAVMAVPRAGARLADAQVSERTRIEVLSNRADLVSGNDALVEVLLPDEADAATVRVTADGRDVTDAFAVRGDGRFLGRVEGLAVGANRLRATLPDGSGARLMVTNHPIGGPVFAGPQIQPWLCATEAHGLGPPLDEQCNAPTIVEFFYMPLGGVQFQPYDPDSPPVNVAMTTTDQGETVPFVVRVERGTMDRGIYDIAVLFDPTQPFEPWAPQIGWNHKLLYTFGAGSGPYHGQDRPSKVLEDGALALGFMVANSGLNFGLRNSNLVVSAEATMMLKEHIVERYGEIRYTISQGCSGGAAGQYSVAGRYPGLLDGLLPQCSGPDLWSGGNEGVDCHLLGRYFTKTSPHLWPVVAQRNAVSGQQPPNGCGAVTADRGPEPLDPSHSSALSNCNVAPEQRFDAGTNPGGVRCTPQDYERAIWGPRPQDGFARRPLDSVGVQYGLNAVNEGLITAEQFVDVNARVGGIDIDANFQADRFEADAGSVEIAYRAGQVTSGHHLANLPIIDLRDADPTHPAWNSYAVRARIVQAAGHADSHVIWHSPIPWELGSQPEWACGTGPTLYELGRRQGGIDVSTPEGACAPDSPLLVMDAWLAAIEADTDEGSRAEKVRRNKPAEAVDTCWIGGERITDQATCRAAFPYYGNPRIAAGGPLANDIMKCRLQPLDRGDYTVDFSDEQWEQLQAAFPEGVCDWSRAGVDQQPPLAWPTFAGGPGGGPLGPAPTSVPLDPAKQPPATTSPRDTPNAPISESPASRPSTGADARPLPATGGGGAAAAGAAAIAAAAALRRRSRPN